MLDRPCKLSWRLSWRGRIRWGSRWRSRVRPEEHVREVEVAGIAPGSLLGYA